jgi:hypothetical protein
MGVGTPLWQEFWQGPGSSADVCLKEIYANQDPCCCLPGGPWPIISVPMGVGTPGRGCLARTFGRLTPTMTRTLTIAVVTSIGMILLILIGHGRAEPQTRTFYNDRGQVTGRRGDTTTFFNEKGQMIGSSRGR